MTSLFLFGEDLAVVSESTTSSPAPRAKVLPRAKTLPRPAAPPVQVLLPLPERPVVALRDEKKRWRALYQRRVSGKVALSLFEPETRKEEEEAELAATQEMGVDLHEATYGACLRQQAGCPFKSCRHHLGGDRHFVEPVTKKRRRSDEDLDDLDDVEPEPEPREFTLSCSLAVARFFPKGLAPEYVAELLGADRNNREELAAGESMVQACEIYALKWLARASEDDGELADALWSAKDLVDKLEEVRQEEPDEEPSRRMGSHSGRPSNED